MNRTHVALVLIVVVAGMSWIVGCGEDSPTGPPEGGSKNNAPNQPAIDTDAGAPDDGATDQAISAVLHWTCADPDGDALTFEVFFGTDAAPPSVATDQANESHNPGGLAHSTTYYWRIIAEDPDGESTSSPVWSFTTLAQGAETVTTPGAPTGPATGDAGASLTYTTSGATSNLGHSVAYRFDWGDGDFSVWSASKSASKTWDDAGSYSVMVQARCAVHPAVESAWSSAFEVVITEVAETVSTPASVTGPASGEINASLSYTTAQATSSLGHYIEYRFDWGDGDFSSWQSAVGGTHNWAAAGTYEVKSQAHCREHPSVESEWSPATTVTITDSETMGRPNITTFPAVGAVGDDLDFYASGGGSSQGHDLEFRWDWDDGSMSDWSASRAGIYAFATAGTYEVRAQVRCAIHTTAVSDWSNPVPVEISDTETITTPVGLLPEYITNVGRTLTVSSNSTSSFGHQVEYYVEWGDGEFNDWATSSSPNHIYDLEGDYDCRVRARCREHTSIMSDWATTTVHVLENVSRPTVDGPATGTVGEEITFTTSGAVSTSGHDLEHRLEIRFVGNTYYTPQEWTTADNLKYTFTIAGSNRIRVSARCIEHEVESTASEFYVLVISN